jgi:hypothetical protein
MRFLAALIWELGDAANFYNYLWSFLFLFQFITGLVIKKNKNKNSLLESCMMKPRFD